MRGSTSSSSSVSAKSTSSSRAPSSAPRRCFGYKPEKMWDAAWDKRVRNPSRLLARDESPVDHLVKERIFQPETYAVTK